MTDTSKDYEKWKYVIEMAKEFADKKGLSFELSNAPYIIAKMKSPDVCIVIYPHKTKSTGNYHARVRDENSKDKEQSENLQAKLSWFYYNWWRGNPDRNGVEVMEFTKNHRSWLPLDHLPSDLAKM